ncbi:MAG: hypothetical protein L0Y44_16725 [Phycisphaerales bacterium]|nr:hypothetical protein [Phycisphaerales bacterium]MCI0632289.1 hypothetical protein [Phycisphaerales bacterium]
MHRLTLTLALTVTAFMSLHGCASKRPAVSTLAEANENDARRYRDASEALEKWQADGGCSGPAHDAIVAKMNELEGNAARWNRVASSLPWQARTARERHTEIAFRFADVSLKRGCLDEADRTYRRLVEFYIGAAYSGIRDRARLGIDDVRAARSTARANAR